MSPIVTGLLIVLLVGGVWLYHYWSEYVLQDLGRKFGFSHEELLARPDPSSRLEMVLAEVQAQYAQLCYRVENLLKRVATSQPSVGARMQRLLTQEPDAAACTELQNVLASLEYYDLLRDWSVAHEMKGYEQESWQLESAFRKLSRIRKRLDSRRVQTA